MEESSLNQFIMKALEEYDNGTTKYYKYIIEKNIKIIDNQLTINNQNFDYELLGYFDNMNNIWVWSWLLPQYNISQTKIARNLLDYGLKLEPYLPKTNNLDYSTKFSSDNEHLFIKSLLVNSKISIESAIQLDINIAIYYYLAHNKFKFILPHKVYSDNNNYITLYYLIK